MKKKGYWELEFSQPKMEKKMLATSEMKITNKGITAPKGFMAAGDFVGIKKAKKDMAIIYSKKPAYCSAVFTKNMVKAAPLILAKKVLAENKYISAIGINSGNANACTGAQGYIDAVNTSIKLAECLNLKQNEVLVSSTGVIGQNLNMPVMLAGVDQVAGKLASGEQADEDCAQAILTTDTFKKQINVEIELGGKTVNISGIAKGSGMIEPNMATTLSFLTTDVNIKEELLDEAFKGCIDDSFNMITVDGDMSTNDTCLILANGCAENPIINKKDENYEKFKAAIEYVLKYLAQQVIHDGEGATKFLEVNLKNAKSKQEARILCKAILNSQLVKTAFFGEDANWGRVISSMGASGVEFDPKGVEISFKSDSGEIKLFEGGEPIEFDEDYALKILKEKEIQINILMNEGEAEATGWGCDLSYEYVKINAEYRS